LRELAAELFRRYGEKFGSNLPQGYGSYCVLWPCRLYPLGEGDGLAQFKNIGAQRPADWRYFPLARAHQGLLAGSRAAGFETLGIHLEHEQMRGWYAFDEGGPSGVGGWHHARTRWPIKRNKDGSPKSAMAMPHGWAVAEFHLLLRDALLHEDGDRLVLFAGVPPKWFTASQGMRIERMPTHFGLCSLRYRLEGGGASLELQSAAPGGCVLALPRDRSMRVLCGGTTVTQQAAQGLLLPSGIRRVQIEFGAQ
jgi:hypothetical protein